MFISVHNVGEMLGSELMVGDPVGLELMDPVGAGVSGGSLVGDGEPAQFGV
jgi:hypothetical protein